MTATFSRLAVRLTAVLATGAALTLGAAEPGSADPAPQTGGWVRYEAQDFTTKAGELCRFALGSTVVFDAEYVRTRARFADGSPKHQTYVGPLVVKITNLESGRSVQRDLSGRAVLRYAADGSYDFAAQGPVAVGFHAGDNLRSGYYVLSGEHTVHFAADGTRTLTRDRGSEENLCRTLG